MFFRCNFDFESDQDIFSGDSEIGSVSETGKSEGRRKRIIAKDSYFRPKWR